MGGMQRLGAVALATIFGLGMTACGDDGGEDASDQVEETTTAKDSGSDSVDPGNFDFSGECADFVEAFGNAGAAVGSAFGGGGSSDDLAQVADYFEEIASNVPEDIRGDFEVFAEAYSDFAQALADSGIDLSDASTANPEDLAALQAVMEAFSAPEVQEASDNISAWVEESCSAG